ncbi:hypothetical protein ACFVZ2_43185, partial [Streptomyces lasiicapitis]
MRPVREIWRPVLEIGGTHVTAALVATSADADSGTGPAQVLRRALRTLVPGGTGELILGGVVG